MATKKKTYLEILAEEQAKDAQRKAAGVIHFKEDSRATRVQYSDPNYTGKSEEKSYKWEKELLDPLKYKGVRSYNDKFKTWASQQGMTPGQAAEFRKYMDFQEDSVWQEPETTTKEDDPKTFKDESIRQNQSLNYARGMYIKGDEIDNILNDMTQRGVQQFQQGNVRAAEKKVEQEEALAQAQQQQTQRNDAVKDYEKNKDDRPAYAKFIDRFLLPISKGMTEVVAPGNNERMIQNDLADGEIDNPVNQASLIDRGTETKVLEGAGTIAGYVAPYGQGYKVSDLALNKLPKLAAAVTNPYAQRAVKGAIAGTAAEGGLAATNELFNSEAKDMQDYALQIGLGAAGGAVLDPALYGVGQGILKGAEKVSQGLVPDSVPFTPEGFQQGLTDAFAPRGNVSNVVADPVPNMPQPFETQYNLTPQQTAQPTLDSFTTNEVPKVETPPVLDDLFNFAQSSTPQARGTTPRVENPARYARENLGNMADTTLNRVNQLDGNRNQRVLEVMQDMKANRNLTPEQDEALTQAQQVWEQRQIREDEFLQQELAPYYESQQAQADIEQQWGTTVKQAKEEAKRIKQQFGKIHVTSGRGDDFVDQIPPQFRANKNELAYDVYKMADEMGMTPEELVQYLKQLDNDSKLRKMDLGTDDGLKINDEQWSQLEEAARRKFAETEEGRAIDQLFTDSLEAGRPTDVDALYAANRGANDPATFDELIKLAEMETNAKPNEPDLKSLLRNDPKVDEALRSLNRLGGARETAAASPSPNVNSLDEMLQFLDGGQTAGRTIENAPTPGLNQNVDEALKRFENVNNSQAVDNTLDNLNPNSERGKFLMRLDSQQHAPTDGSTLVETDPTVTTTSPIDMQTNPFKRSISNFYQKYVNRNHQAKVAEVQILKNAGELDAAKKVQKYGSDFDKAVGNELAAGSAAKNLLDRNFSALEQSVKDLGPDKGKAMAEAMDYQLAMNLDWIRQSDPDYTLPNGWDWGRVNSIINKGVDGKYKPFTDAMYSLNQEVRDVMLDYGLVTKDVHKILGDNPFYVPMARDISQLLDNIDVGMSQRAGNRRRGAGAGIIYGLKGGDAETFIKNPLDTLVERTFTMYQNAMRNDTAQQALRLAEIDDGSLGLVKKISQKQYKEGGGLMVLQDGKRQYIRLQQDLQKMLDENQSALDLGKIGKATQLFAGLKTRSLEYQSAAIVRDLGQGYLTSQITDPIRYTQEFFRSLGSKSMSAKEAGAYFDRAHNDHTGGVDPKRLLEEYQKRTGNVKSFKVNDKQSWKGLGNAIQRTIDKIDVARRLGQVTDEIPRDIEVRETERLFMKKHGAEIESLNQQLEAINQQASAAQGAPAFSPQTQGIDALLEQRNGIESRLRELKQNLRREQVYRGRDVMDYSRSGGGKTAKNIRAWVIFANTTTQSKDKVIRSFIERPGATTAKLVGLVGPMVALQQMNFDNMNEEEKGVYDNLPDYMKQYNYVFVNDGDVFAVPKLHELALVTNPIEAALKGEDQNEAMRLLVKELVPYQGGNFAQGLVPNANGSMTYRDNTQWPSTVLSPSQDIEANKKMGFNDKPISFGGYYKGADAAANDWTLDVFKRAIGDNPGADFTQYGIEQYGGDYGKYLNQILNAGFGRNDNKVEEALRYLNPAQDRVFLEDGTIDIGGIKIPVRTPAQETKK
jgi:hypothetical protein